MRKTWLPLSDAATATGQSKGAIRGQARRGTRDVKIGTDGKYLYRVDVDSPPPKKNVLVDLPTKPSKTDTYVFDGQNYYFSLRSVPKGLFTVSKQTIEQLVQSYSYEGQHATLQELSRVLTWSRRTVREVLRALGVTHSSLPFTDEQIEDQPEEVLVEDMVRAKEQRIYVAAQRKVLEEQKLLATKASNIREFIRSVLPEVSLPTPPTREIAKVASGVTVVSHATDLHFGKDGWRLRAGAESYSREECRRRLLSATGALIGRVDKWGHVKRVILGVGGDWFHVDNHRNTTTAGTPQDADGNYRRIFMEGCQLAYEHIEMWRTAGAPVEIVAVRGNHDYYSTMMLVLWLEALYRDVDGVKVHALDEDRHYLHVGNTLLGMTHGDSTKDRDLRALMSCEAKDLWAKTEHRLWLTGHWHSQIVSEQYGVVVEHLPSLAGSDAWHVKQGYVGNRKLLMAHIIDDKHGPVAKVWADAKE